MCMMKAVCELRSLRKGAYKIWREKRKKNRTEIGVERTVVD